MVAQRARKAALGLGHAGLAGVDVDGHALDGVDDRKTVGTGSLEGLSDLGDVDRCHLHEQRLVGHLTARGHDGRGALGRGAHGGTAGGDIRAAHVDLVAGSPGAQLDIHLECADKLVNGVAGNLTDDLAAVLGQLLEPRTGLAGKGGHAGVLKAHGVDHTAGNLGHAGGGVAGPGLGSATLGGDGAQLGNIKEVLELPTVAKGTGCGVDGVLHLDAAEIDGHVHGTH